MSSENVFHLFAVKKLLSPRGVCSFPFSIDRYLISVCKDMSRRASVLMNSGRNFDRKCAYNGPVAWLTDVGICVIERERTCI